MWFTLLLHSVHADTRRLRSGRLSKQSKTQSGTRLNLERLETRSLPSGFGSVGYVTTSLSGGGDVAQAVALQPDGKILAAGISNDNQVSAQFGLVRYNSDGTLDTSFNGTGIVLTSFNSNAAFGQALALQSDGKIIEGGNFVAKISGGFFRTFDYDAALARFNPNGTLDTTFGTGKKPTGRVTTDYGSNGDTLKGLAIQSDGKIVSAGYQDGQVLEVARYNSNGSLDATFGTGGLVATAGAGSGSGVALQADGRIVASADTGTQFEIVRFNTNGTLDTSFGGSGIVTTVIGSSTTVHTNAIAIFPNAGTVNDGKIVAVGQGSSTAGGQTWVIARYNPDGSLDSTFGTGGIVQSNHTGNAVGANAVAIQSDGKIVVTGLNNVSLPGQYAVDRFNTDGSLDATFGSGGIVVTQIGPTTNTSNGDDTYGVALQTNGQIVVAGDASDGTNIDFLVARYNTNGTLDPLPSTPSKSDTSDRSSDQGNAPAVGHSGQHAVNSIAPDILSALESSSNSPRHLELAQNSLSASRLNHLWSDFDADTLMLSFTHDLNGIR